MLRCVLRESWRDFLESKFFEEFSVVCFCSIVVVGIAAIGYGLWTLLAWAFGEMVVALAFAAAVFIGLAVGFIKLCWKAIVAIKENIAYCRTRQ